MSGKKFKTNKNKIQKLSKKVFDMCAGIPVDMVTKHGGELRTVNDNPKTVADQEEVLAALEHNLKCARRARDWWTNWNIECDKMREAQEKEEATREVREQHKKENLENKLSALSNKFSSSRRDDQGNKYPRHRGNVERRNNG